MLAILNRSRSLRGGNGSGSSRNNNGSKSSIAHNGSAASVAFGGKPGEGVTATPPNSHTETNTTATNTSSSSTSSSAGSFSSSSFSSASSSSTTNAGGDGKTHGPNAPNATFVAAPNKSNASAASTRPATSTSAATAAEPGRVSGPTLQTSTVLGLVEDNAINSNNSSSTNTNTNSHNNTGMAASSPPTPSPGLDGKRECPYVNRPLPPPPPSSKNSIIMPSATLTSASTAASAPTRQQPPPRQGRARAATTDNMNRRMSRDDMFLNSRTKTAMFSPATDSMHSAHNNKRMSRDDFYLDTRSKPSASAGHGINSGAFHIPLRNGQLPTPEESPNFAHAVPVGTAPLVRMATPESIMSGEGEIQIGMALGSPTHPPEQQQYVPDQQQQQHAPEQALKRSQTAGVSGWSQSTSSTPTPEPPIQRSKTTRRKLFGLFGSKRYQDVPAAKTITSSASSFSQETGSESSSIMMSTASGASSSWTDKPLTRSGTNKKYQPIMVQASPEQIMASPLRSATTPSITTTTGNNSASSSKRPFLRSKTSEPGFRQPQQLQTQTMHSSQTTHPTALFPNIPAPQHGSGRQQQGEFKGASPYLDVEIPDVRLERYSVMFGSLLPPSAMAPASSLLARRQATIDKLKAVNDRILQEDMERERAALMGDQPKESSTHLHAHPAPVRRATSPQPITKSPGFMLFPANGPAPPASPRFRSNTSPSAMASPSQSEQSWPQSHRQTQQPAKQQSLQHRPSPLQKPQQPQSQLQPQQQQQRFINPLRENPTSINSRPPVRSANATPTTTTQQPQKAQQQQPRRPQVTTTFQFDPTQSNLILDSPTDMEFEEEEPQPQPQKHQKKTGSTQSSASAAPAPFKPVIPEPQWQMVSPPQPPPSTASVSSNASSGSATSHLLKGAATPGDNNHSSEKDGLTSAVEISIARQISISRQQRQLLRPLQQSPSSGVALTSGGALAAVAAAVSGGIAVSSPTIGGPRSASSASSSSSTPVSSPRIKLGRNERLQETKTATPTLVVPEVHGEEHQTHLQPRPRPRGGNNQNHLQAYQIAQNRKSERVILEAA